MPAFLPLNFADNAAPVTPVPNGMSPLTAGYQLAGLANQIKASLPPELKGSDHSIPNIGAYIEYLRADILHNRAGSSYVQCWHGVLAMVGLSKLYGFELSLQLVDMTQPPVHVGGHISPGPIYKRELERLQMLDHNTYYVLYRTVWENGQPKQRALAVVDPNILIVPLKNIDPAALVGVPWYDAHTGTWREVTDGYDEKPLDAQRKMLAEHLQLALWLERQATVASGKMKTGLATNLSAWRDQLRHGTPLPVEGRQGTIPCQGLPPTMDAIDFGAFSQKDFCRVPDYQISMDGIQLFTPRLMLTNVAKLSTTTPWNCVVKDANQQMLSVLPPITADFANLLDQYSEPDGSGYKPLELLQIKVEDEFIANSRIRVELVYRNGSLIVSRTQEYNGRQIVFAKNFPYFSMWPYVNLKRGEWNMYTVSMVAHNQVAFEPSNCEVIDAMDSRLSYVADPDDITIVEPRDDVNRQIQMRFSENFPSFVPLHYTDALGNVLECGSLLAAPAGNQVIPATALIAKACIDFGTSNSVCAVEAGGVIHQVMNGDRVCALVQFNKNSDENDSAINEFHRYYGLSKSSRPYKFPSVAQLYKGSAADPLRSGKILLAESGVIDYFAKQNTNLDMVGIFSYLKSDVRAPLAAVNQAEEIFIKHLALLCALEAKCVGASGIEYYFSYPNDQYRNTLTSFWDSAINYINRMNIFPAIDTPGSLTERMASSYHVQTNMEKAAMMASKGPGFAVVDIGGGTSDMTVWRAPLGGDDPIFRGDEAMIKRAAQQFKKEKTFPAVQGANLSFRYAGNQLFSHTFFVYFKSHSNIMNQVFPRIFGFSENDLSSTTAMGSKKRAIEAVKSYMTSLSSIQSLKSPGFPALTALLNTLLEEPGVDMTYWGGAACRELRNMISFKLKGILFVLGLLVGECAGINPDNETGTFKIYLVGGGAQAYNMTNKTTFKENAFDMLAQLPGMQFDEIYDDVESLRQRFEIIPPADGNKIEVVDGMLSYENDFAGKTDRGLVPRIRHEEANPPASELREAYQDYIRIAVEDDPNLQDLLPMLQVVNDASNRDAQQNQTYQHYMNTANNLWTDLNTHLDDDVSLVVREAIFAVLMAEELLS